MVERKLFKLVSVYREFDVPLIELLWSFVGGHERGAVANPPPVTIF